MIEENLNLLNNLYQQYVNPVKPLLAEIEAVYEKFPLALYNEIRAMNDHVARAFTATNDDKAKTQIEKASNHLNRITRDCYKLLNLYYKTEAENFDRSIYSVEPRTTTDCERMANYGRLSNTAINLVEKAKSEEHLVTDEVTYQNFQNAYKAYRALHKFIIENQQEVLILNRKKKLAYVFSFLFSIFTFILGCIITNNNQEIVEAVMNFLPK